MFFYIILWGLVACQQKTKPTLPGKARSNEQPQLPQSKIKYHPLFSFPDFPVDTFKGSRSPINFESNKIAPKYKSAISWAYKEFGLQFGGHYGIARWSYGPNTVDGVLIDLKNGNVYNLPTGSNDYSYKKDSRLLIVNPPDSAGNYDTCFYCVPELWLWNETGKKFEPLK